MKKTMFAFLLVVCLVISASSAYGINADVNNVSSITIDPYNTEKFINSAAEAWLLQNYKEFYDIKDVHADIIRTHKAETATNYTVAISCMTKLRVASAEELPFVQGMYAEMSNMESISGVAKESIDQYVDKIDFTNEYTPLSLEIVIAVSDLSKGAGLTMYFQDGMDTTLYPIEALELDSKQMYQDGRSTVSAIVAAYKDVASYQDVVSLMGYSSYNRVAARDYAFAWVGSNVTSCYDDGSSCTVRQDRTLWNNTTYPYISSLKHNDCADFVSQSIKAGGIPVESTKWDRFNDGNNGWSWTYVPGLKSYMTGKGYWDTSTFAAANAGNILIWSDESHVALITLNDTVTHRFTAHTSDRYNYQFTNSSSYNYYTIKTT